jgi:hypothetical protein
MRIRAAICMENIIVQRIISLSDLQQIVRCDSFGKVCTHVRGQFVPVLCTQAKVQQTIPRINTIYLGGIHGAFVFVFVFVEFRCIT